MNKQRRTRLLTLHARFSSLCDELEPICEEEQTAADALTEYFEKPSKPTMHRAWQKPSLKSSMPSARFWTH